MEAKQWAAWTHELFSDSRTLVEIIEAATPLAEERRRQVVKAALVSLWQEDLLSIARAAKGRVRLGDSELQEIMMETRRLVSGDRKAEALEPVHALIERIKTLENAPVIELEMLRTLRPFAVEADTAARQEEAQVSSRVQAQVHRLSGSISGALWARGLTESASRLRSVLSRIPRDIAEEVAPGSESILNVLCDRLCSPLEMLAKDPAPESLAQISEVLDRLVSEMQALAAIIARVRHSESESYSGEVRRIVVIEDDGFWRDAVIGVLESMSLSVSLEAASDAAAASKLLSASKDGTLALVDLGLPLTASDAEQGIVDLDAGLGLVERFSPPEHRCRFIVLTASENYSDGVRTAIAAGVEPADYIHKDPDIWEEQLRSRVQIALGPRPRRLPRVQVFKCTARLIAVDGVEVALERKPYVVFEYLAERARRWCPLDKIRLDLCMDPRDITPAMSPEEIARCDRGEQAWPSPFDLLSEERIHDYVYDIRRTVEAAFGKVDRAALVPQLIAFDEESRGYRLQADADVYERFEDLRRRAVRYAVLVVEDDPWWCSAIVEELSSCGFGVQSAQTVEDAERIAEEAPPDVVSLDLQLPRDEAELQAGTVHEANGLAVLQFLKARFPEIKIAVLTSIAWKDSVMLEVLREGIVLADFISKQWSSPIQRLAGSLWRLSLEAERGSRIPDEGDISRLHQIEIDPEQPDIFRLDGQDVQLSRGPAKVFRLLAMSPNAPISRDILIDAVWKPEELPEDFEGALNTLVARICREISKATGGKVSGRELIRSKDGVYWLQGIIRPRSRSA
jgi:DNA-binding response OmpR family regulator